MLYKPRAFSCFCTNNAMNNGELVICLPYRKFNMTLPKRKHTEVFTSMHIHSRTDIIYAKHTFAKYAVSQRQNNVHFFGFSTYPRRLLVCLTLTSLSSLSTQQLVVLFGIVEIFIAWRFTLDDKILGHTYTHTNTRTHNSNTLLFNVNSSRHIWISINYQNFSLPSYTNILLISKYPCNWLWHMSLADASNKCCHTHTNAVYTALQLFLLIAM